MLTSSLLPCKRMKWCCCDAPTNHNSSTCEWKVHYAHVAEKMYSMLPNSNCKLPNIEVAELAVWYKSMLCLQANSCHLRSERAWSISLTPCLRRKQKCAARPGRRPRCGGWQKSMWNRALTWMHPTCADRWEKTWPIKVGIAWESTQRLSQHSDVFLQTF